MPESIEQILRPVVRDLGEFDVRRTLPAKSRQRVGPFIFFDHFGPVEFAPGAGIAVRPHPHIGLATITYLFDGAIVHRDSLGTEQTILPGAVNWMTAGRGIVHSERSPAQDVSTGAKMHGLQTWLALPVEKEEIDPRFEHFPASAVPSVDIEGGSVAVIAGSLAGVTSPVRTESGTVYADIVLEEGASFVVPDGVGERAIYCVGGLATIDGFRLDVATMAIVASGATPEIRALESARVMLLGGDHLPGERFLWWNFVSSSRERIGKAKSDWRDGRFDPVPGDNEFIPLPEK